MRFRLAGAANLSGAFEYRQFMVLWDQPKAISKRSTPRLTTVSGRCFFHVWSRA